MLCSNCSQEIKPVVAFDVDGTLGNYHGQLIQFAEQYIGHPARMDERPYDGVMNFGDWIMEAFDIPSRKEYRDIKLAFRQGGAKRWMPPFPDMIEAVRFAKEGLGAEIWLTTTRPYLRLDSVDPDTREWLRRHDVQFDHLLYDDHKYQVLVERVDPRRVVAIIDDLAEQLEEANVEFFDKRSIKCPTILVRKGYNEGVEFEGASVTEGRGLSRILRERVEKWQRKSHKLMERSMTTSTTN